MAKNQGLMFDNKSSPIIVIEDILKYMHHDM